MRPFASCPSHCATSAQLALMPVWGVSTPPLGREEYQPSERGYLIGYAPRCEMGGCRVARVTSPSMTSIVVPWYQGGDLMRHAERSPHTPLDYPLIDMAR